MFVESVLYTNGTGALHFIVLSLNYNVFTLTNVMVPLKKCHITFFYSKYTQYFTLSICNVIGGIGNQGSHLVFSCPFCYMRDFVKVV